MNFIDTHTHLYDEYYPGTYRAVIQRAIDANVTQMIMPSVNSKTPAEIAEVRALFPNNIYELVGLHPEDVLENYEAELSLLESHLDDEGVIGIGEIGLDFYFDRNHEQLQKEAFFRQLCWARDRQLPLSLHIRNAYNEALEILQKFKKGELTGVLHCFSGGIQEANWAIKHGFALGVGGIITFKNNKLQDIVKAVGINHIVLETDAPFLAPVPHRGTPNESSFIPIIAEKVASVLDISVQTVQETTSENCYRIFTKMHHA